MSYILKALRKSEKERQARHPESVTDRILAPETPRKSRKTALWIGAIIVSNLLLIGGYYWFSTKTPDTSPASQTSKAPAEPADVQPPGQASTVISEPPEPFAQRKQNMPSSIAERIAARRRRSNQAQPETGKAATPETPPVSAPPAGNDTTPSGTEEEISAPEEQPVQPDDAEIQEEAMTEEPAPLDSKPEDIKIPYFDELPYEVRQTIPKMSINAFVYGADPSERFVVINMEKYKAGQKTKDSVLLKEIRRDSVVVSYQDRVFQIQRP